MCAGAWAAPQLRGGEAPARAVLRLAGRSRSSTVRDGITSRRGTFLSCVTAEPTSSQAGSGVGTGGAGRVPLRPTGHLPQPHCQGQRGWSPSAAWDGKSLSAPRPSAPQCRGQEPMSSELAAGRAGHAVVTQWRGGDGRLRPLTHTRPSVTGRMGQDLWALTA